MLRAVFRGVDSLDHGDFLVALIVYLRGVRLAQDFEVAAGGGLRAVRPRVYVIRHLPKGAAPRRSVARADLGLHVRFLYRQVLLPLGGGRLGRRPGLLACELLAASLHIADELVANTDLIEDLPVVVRVALLQ